MHLLQWFTASVPEAVPAVLALVGLALARVGLSMAAQSLRMRPGRTTGRS